MQNDYNPLEIEQSAQQYWENSTIFKATEDASSEKYFCLSMMPYPSGELHMGHVRNYAIGDVIARYEKMKGKNVMQPWAWDAFGLPAENAASKHQLPPHDWTQKNINVMRTQLKQLGLAVDWSRETSTCEPTYYQFEQWLFVQLFKKGLAYKKKSLVNWDPVDQTVLANEQVIDGKGWRSGAPVERREISQWFLKITDYAEPLLNDLDSLSGWPRQVVEMQRNWIGKSEGVEIDFTVNNKVLAVYTTRADTLMGATYLGIAVEHPLAQAAAANNPALKAFLASCKKSSVSEADIATQEKLGMDTGLFANHPITQKKIPVWVTNFVLMEYGSGAVMAVPAHDERDHEFAKKYKLPIQPVIKTDSWDFEKAAFTEHGPLINSAVFDGLEGTDAIAKIRDHLIQKNAGKPCVNYRLRDWGISRQRYWGTPIPMIHCDACGDVPVDEKELPVVLPTNLIPTGQGSPLVECEAFYKTTCPHCKKPAKRETDTMDTFVESSWYFARLCSFDQAKTIVDERVNYWMPVDHYVGGIEHAILHLLYSRFIHKVLRDFGFIQCDEPFKNLLTQGMVLKDGAKMSKSKGNVVAPQALIQKYGVDTARLFMIFAAPPEQSLEWSDAGVEGAHRFLKKLWKFAATLPASKTTIAQPILESDNRALHQILQQANTDMARQQFNTVVSAAMKFLNILQEKTDKGAIHAEFSVLLRLLSPIVPHITHELWNALGYGGDIATAPWPIANKELLSSGAREFVIQVNGKLRGKITISPDESEASIQEKALQDINVQAFLKDKIVQRVIVIPNRLVNIVVA
ncbi:MAG: leucine--tRNA ligase [Coxiellaceae bacterium]|nr:leucine--tRNA ligase [Coxiellaceae bacterium]